MQPSRNLRIAVEDTFASMRTLRIYRLWETKGGSMARDITRRSFVKGAAAAGGMAAVVGASALADPYPPAAKAFADQAGDEGMWVRTTC